ncbi:hypothetical protein C8F01DRAFT_1174654 [Mycena amicta]|nr:hypothetical protein C8F01DRAFT_1174654 [Mycena amicta]
MGFVPRRTQCLPLPCRYIYLHLYLYYCQRQLGNRHGHGGACEVAGCRECECQREWWWWGGGHVPEASEDSEVRFPGRWTGTSATGTTTTGIGFGVGFGLLTPAGSVSARTGNGNGHVQLSAPPPPTQPHPSKRKLGRDKGVSTQSMEEVLLLLGALGAGAAIVGAAWWGAA